MLLRILASVVNDQVHDLLLIQSGLGPKMRERQIVSRLALVFQVVALPQPGVLEPHVRSHPAVEHLLRDARVRSITRGLSAKRSAHSRAALSCACGSGMRRCRGTLSKSDEVVAPVGERVDHDILRIGGVLEIPGARNPSIRAKSARRS